MKFDNSVNKFLNEQAIKRIGIFPGAFKPPHLGHFKTVQRAATENDEVYVFISKKEREGITLMQSLQLWDLYKELLPPNIIIKTSDITPVKDTYDLVEQLNASPDAPNTEVTIYAGTQEDFNSRYGTFITSDKYTENLGAFHSGEIISIQPSHPTLKKLDPNKLSASALRQVLKSGDYEAFLSALPDVDKQKVLDIFA